DTGGNATAVRNKPAHDLAGATRCAQQEPQGLFPAPIRARVGRLLRVRHNGTTWRVQTLACGLSRHQGGVHDPMTEGTESAHSVARERRREHGPKSTLHWLGTPQPTVEAVMYELRTDGVAALKESNCRRRLGDLSRDQFKEVIARLIKL